MGSDEAKVDHRTLPRTRRTERRTLTVKQWKFIEAYKNQLPYERSGRQAALEAGYEARTAKRKAAELLENPVVREMLLEETATEVRRVTEMAAVDKAWLLREVHDLWNTPLSAILNEDGTVKPINDMPDYAQKLIAGFKVVRRVVDEQPVEYTEVKLINRVELLRMIGQHTNVDAFGTGAEAEKNESMAKLMTAIANAAQRGDIIEINPKENDK